MPPLHSVPHKTSIFDGDLSAFSIVTCLKAQILFPLPLLPLSKYSNLVAKQLIEGSKFVLAVSFLLLFCYPTTYRWPYPRYHRGSGHRSEQGVIGTIQTR